MIDLSMTTDRLGYTESGMLVPIGTKVTYCGHVPGGMVRVELADGTKHVMHPHCFETLRR